MRCTKAVKSRLKAHGVNDGIVVDLGCGTGDLTLLLAQDGYDMIEWISPMKCSVFSGKSRGAECFQFAFVVPEFVGWICMGRCAAVSTFDTLNHIGPYADFCKAIQRAALFIEPNGLMLFDMNTPYKHEHVLENQVF